MKKCIAMLAAGLLCACCLGLAACGGSGSVSAASGSASAGSSSSSVGSASADSSTASASTSSVSAASSVASASADDVSLRLKEAAERLVALADEEAALVEKAKAAESFDAVKAEWEELSKKVDEVTDALKPWAQKYADGTLSDADKSYYMKVVVPAASKSANAGLELLDLIKL